jgi:hypothetical protein
MRQIHWAETGEKGRQVMTFDPVKLGAEVIAIASFAHTILPPWEAFNDFPRVQKYYKLFVYIVGYAALNGRSTVYPSLSTASGTKQSDAVIKTANGGAQ